MNPFEKFPDIVKKRESLDILKETHSGYYLQMMKADEGKFYLDEILIIAVLKRSLDLSDGVLCMIEKWNYVCAGALLRLQVDNLIRIHYASQRRNVDILKGFVEGKPMNKYKHTDGDKLTDKKLRELASIVYPWVDNIYKDTSSLVHLSSKPYFTLITNLNEDTKTVTSRFSTGSPNWPKSEIEKLLDAFTLTTKSILNLVEGWIKTKENFKDTKKLQ